MEGKLAGKVLTDEVSNTSLEEMDKAAQASCKKAESSWFKLPAGNDGSEDERTPKDGLSKSHSNFAKALIEAEKNPSGMQGRSALMQKFQREHSNDEWQEFKALDKGAKEVFKKNWVLKETHKTKHQSEQLFFNFV